MGERSELDRRVIRKEPLKQFLCDGEWKRAGPPSSKNNYFFLKYIGFQTNVIELHYITEPCCLLAIPIFKNSPSLRLSESSLDTVK